MKRYIFTACLIGATFASQAQSDVDALRFSMPGNGFTARSWGMGGAFGAVGSDLSSISINAASLAQYKQSSFSFSLGSLGSKASSDYIGNTTKDNLYNLNMPSVGLVFVNRKYDGKEPAKKGWVNTNVGLSITRVGEFNRVINYGATNSRTSMLDYWAQSANGFTVDQIRGRDEEFNSGFYDIEPMFWEGYLIDSAGDRLYRAAIDDAYRNIGQKHLIRSSGRMYDYTFSLAGNYNNMLYIGGDVHLTSVNYDETNRFREFDDPAGGNIWDSYDFERELSTNGTGIGGRLGMVIRPSDLFRIGFAYQTPTIYTLTDVYQDNLKSFLDNGSYYTFSTLEGEFTYKVITPAKTTVSGAVFAGKKGFVSMDVDFMDYSTMHLNADEDEFEDINDLIAEKYQMAVNLRLGAEYVLKQLRFRAGYANYGSPFSDQVGEPGFSKQFFTAGVGIFERDWSLDFAVVHERQEDITQPYVLDNTRVDYATNKLANNRMVVTLTTRF